MGGFWNRRFWMWVLVVPAIVLGTFAAVGDTFQAAAKLWWVSGPVLLVWALVIWRWLEPVRAEGETPKPTALPDVLVRLFLTVVLTCLSLVTLGVVVALAGWAKGYWFVVAPVIVGFVVAMWLAQRPDRSKLPPRGGGDNESRDIAR
jgi:hypothetical protein